MKKKVAVWIILLIVGWFNVSYAVTNKNVYVIPIKGEVNPALTQFVKHSIKEAEKDSDAVAVIFEVNTLGGMIVEATKIRDAMMDTSLQTISFINHKAESAGVLISIASQKMIMSNGSTIGSAETIPYTEKNISYWKGELRTTAQQIGRDPLLIESMADRRLEIKQQKGSGYVVKKGELLNLTTQEAYNLGLIDEVAQSYDEVLNKLKVDHTKVIKVSPDLKVQVAQAVTSSVLLPILLSIGFIGIVIEVFTPGFGIGGTIGLIAFSVFFGGNFLAGNASLGVILLFIVGIILLFIEAIAPGFGAPGIGGILCMGMSIVLASDSVVLGVVSLMIAILVAVIVAIILFKYGPRYKFLDKVILDTSLEKHKGFVAVTNENDLLYKEGITLTPLHPSGAIKVGDIRLDVITQGEYIRNGEWVKIIRIQGRKIVVAKTNKEE